MAAPTQARITSTEALETFRAALVVFLSKAKRALDDAGDEMRRTRQWVTHDQRVHWEGEYRRRVKRLDQAKQELMSAKMGGGQHSAVVARQMALQKAERDVAEADAKIRKLKGWAQNFDSAADPVMKRMDKLRSTLAEYPKAIAYLVAIQKTLDAYIESSRAPESGNEIASMAAELGIETESFAAGQTAPAADATTEGQPAPESAPGEPASDTVSEPPPTDTRP